jgi:hypothetical protein
MAKYTRLLLGACVAILALAIAVGTASALRSIQISNPGAITGTGVRVSFEDESRFLRTVCNLTLSGRGNEKIAKRPEAVTGTITSGRTRECSAFGVAAEVLVLAEELAPFTQVYRSILGTLPNITGVNTITRNSGFVIRALGRTCLYFGDAEFLYVVAAGSSSRGTFGARRIPLRREGSTAECPAQGGLVGTLTFERARTVTLV